jgi:hypothetical protein
MVMIAHMAVADYFSFWAVVFILSSSVLQVECRLNKYAMRGVNNAISLAMGLSWEKVFDGGSDGLGEFMPAGNDNSTLQTVVKLGFVLIVFPAWMVYMLPNADDDIKAAMADVLAKGNLPCSACWNDEDLYDEHSDVE